MAMLVESRSSLGKFCEPLAVGRLWCPFLRAQTPLSSATRSISAISGGYMRGLLDYPTFEVRFLKRCLQKTASTVFGTHDVFLNTEFIITRLKGAEHRDWMQSRQSLRKAIETGDLSLPGLVDVVSNLFGVRPHIFSYLKETGWKDTGDSLVVWLSLLIPVSA